MSIQEEILHSIEIMVQESIHKFQNTEIAAIVNEVTADGLYVVDIDGIAYTVKDGINLNPSVGTPVWVKLPYGTGNMTGAYIMARR